VSLFPNSLPISACGRFQTSVSKGNCFFLKRYELSSVFTSSLHNYEVEMQVGGNIYSWIAEFKILADIKKLPPLTPDGVLVKGLYR